MDEFNWIKELGEILEDMEEESKLNIYMLKPEAVKKAAIVGRILKDTDLTIRFDPVVNAIEIIVLDYVYDSYLCDLKQVFQTVDLFSIDALTDGRVSIEMKLLKAAEIIGRNKNG